MKRIYIALGFLILCFAIGLSEYNIVTSGSEYYARRLDSIEDELNDGKYMKAESDLKKTAEEFSRFSENTLYFFYNHKSTKEIEEKLYSLSEHIRLGRIDDFFLLKKTIKKELLALRDKEQITLNNII